MCQPMKQIFALQMDTESSLPEPISNANALATAPTEPVPQPPTSQAAAQAASTQPPASEQPAAPQQPDAPIQPQQPAAAVAVQQSEGPVQEQSEAFAQAQQQQQQQQANGVAAAADGGPEAMQEDNMPSFASGTVLQFDLDAADVADSTTLDFRAIRPVFGGKEGGVRHCEYRKVSSLH